MHCTPFELSVNTEVKFKQQVVSADVSVTVLYHHQVAGVCTGSGITAGQECEESAIFSSTHAVLFYSILRVAYVPLMLMTVFALVTSFGFFFFQIWCINSSQDLEFSSLKSNMGIFSQFKNLQHHMNSCDRSQIVGQSALSIDSDGST